MMHCGFKNNDVTLLAVLKINIYVNQEKNENDLYYHIDLNCSKQL